MNKPPNTLVDRPAQRDWTIWLAGLFVAVAHLWDVVDIYLLDRRIYGVLGPQGSAMTLLAELLFAAMTATFIIVVLTTSRRALRNLRYQRYLTRNVIIMTAATDDRRTLRPDTPIGLRFNHEEPATSMGAEESLQV